MMTPASNMVGLRNGEEDLGNSTIKVFLMTNQDRFRQFNMEHVGDQLIFEEQKVDSTVPRSREQSAAKRLQ